ncbi:MAG TPA: undecaprenyl-diphosphate phosphatase [Microscillaceae bacterium]|jgi:undecaprenyl-diphosphatase|nr:undecaprenyl-diphosphate phosphatase [Microscillaceae bacterium]
MSILEAIILAIVEGITEFLPISSTGHMILVSKFMNIHEAPFTKIFEVNIQFGAILSVVVLYYKRFFQSFTFYFKLFVAFLPAAVLGLLFEKQIDALLSSVEVVIAALFLGGFFLVWVDTLFPQNQDEEIEIPYLNALKIGFFQALAMIPGVSRSAASIIGGMSQGLSRRQAAEFSFFLAVPTMFAASSYKVLKGILKGEMQLQGGYDVGILLLGNVVAFVVALLAIRFFINFLTRYGFRVFGYYRIALGLILWILIALGYDLKMVD